MNNYGLIAGPDPAYVDIPGIGLTVLPGTDVYSSAWGVNNFGDVVGNGSAWNVDLQGVITGPFDLGTFDAHAINDDGVMAGNQDDIPAIAWFDGGTLQVQQLGLLPGASIGYALAINNLGSVVGEVREDIGNGWRSHAFLWTPATGMVGLGDLGGGSSVANDINDNGQIVGSTYTAGGALVAFLWQNGKMSDLNGLCNAGSKNRLFRADGINASGQIVGAMQVTVKSSAEDHAFLLTKNP